MSHENEPENAHEIASACASIIEGTLTACGLAGEHLDVEPAEIAHHVLSGLMMFLADQNDEDNLLCMIKKVDGWWRTHIHYDYLSADHDHFKGDFDWGSPEPHNG